MGSINYLSAEIRKAYKNNQEDETLEPLVLTDVNGIPIGRIKSGDAVIFYNIRGEREVELSRSLTESGFDEFPVEVDFTSDLTTMIQYQKDLNVVVAFPPEDIVEDTLSDVISAHGLRQVKITEAEKAIHVGFFLNGKKSEPGPGEERIVVPTRKDVALFDEAPEMSIDAITEVTIEKINDPSVQFIFTNFPNVDVVGHIENEPAVLSAIEAVDRHLGLVVDEAREKGLSIIITADHGTVEKWQYPDGTIDTGHTDSPVPFFLIHGGYDQSLRNGGTLSDIAPTILDLFGLPKPPIMTGRSLMDKKRSTHRSACNRLLLVLLDGWGESSSSQGNLIAKANTPRMDTFKKSHPWTTLLASGEAVGLPPGTVGNSEAGHLHIGAGRTIFSDRLKIDQAIQEGTFFHNPAFLQAMNRSLNLGTSLHLMGIVSFFSSHGSIHHLFALMDLAKQSGIKALYIHAMLGRRGELPESGAIYIERVEQKAREIGLGKVVSVIGRYWSMDREENWDRIEKTYRMLVLGAGMHIPEGE
jgi:2,3-bisphosphoglycerate-independent phosphoglycerate mutase